MKILTQLEQTALAECEAVIEQGLAEFIQVGTALLRIRDERLYRATHKTFEKYCRERWKWSRSYAHRLIEAAQVVQNLLPIGNTPKNEAQARELACLTPGEQRDVARTIDFDQTTAHKLKQVVEARVMKENKNKVERNAMRANETRAARIAELKKVCRQLADLPQPVSQADFRKTAAPRGNGMISELSIFPWFRVEVVAGSAKIAYHCAIDEDLKALCDAVTPIPIHSGLETPVGFFRRLTNELSQRRAQLDGIHRNRSWDLDKLRKLDLVNLLDWVEQELSTFGKSVAIAHENAAKKLQLIERKETA